MTSNFSFSHSVFYLFGELSAIFIKYRIVIVQTLSVWMSLKFVVWERVKVKFCEFIGLIDKKMGWYITVFLTDGQHIFFFLKNLKNKEMICYKKKASYHISVNIFSIKNDSSSNNSSNCINCELWGGLSNLPFIDEAVV